MGQLKPENSAKGNYVETIQSKTARLQSKDIRIKFVCVEF